MISRRMVLLVSVVALGSAAARSRKAWSADDSRSIAAVDAKILREIREHSEVMDNLEYLSDVIGPRVTGSPQLKRASDWTAAKFREYGLTNVKLEPWSIPRSWTRGIARARIVSPSEHPLTIASAGWSPGTNGVARGRLAYLDAKTKEDFEKFRGQLKGAMVIYQEPQSLSPPPPFNPDIPFLRPMQAPPPEGQPSAPSPFAALQEVSRARNDFLKQEGVAVVLRDSDKPHGLLDMTRAAQAFEIGSLPTAFITSEGYRLLYRMQQRGKVEVEIEMTNTFGDNPMDVYNTVAELRGTEKPEEVVILGAHLDSWDLGTGSTDNGTGSMAVLEAARALAALGLKPKRTIRFVLFTGEEEGLVGSARYVEAHRSELDKISAVLVHDAGTGHVRALGLHDNYQARELVDEVLEPLKDLKLLESSMARSFGTDHASFDETGVPGFFCIQDFAEYPKTHHSQSDTFDKVWKDDVNQGAQVLAAWAYNTAQLPVMLPRRPLPPKPLGDSVKPEPAKPDAMAEMDAKIIEQVKADENDLKSNLQYLTDRIGPRLTGSPQLDQASRWTMERFREGGLSNAHLEPWTIANGWTRGPASGRVVSPAVHPLSLALLGWSEGTKGPVRGPVVGFEAEKVEDLQLYKGKLKGAIVVTGRPREMVTPGNPLLTPWGEEITPFAYPKPDPNKPFDFEAMMRLRRARIKLFAEEGVVAVLGGSEKWYELLNMGSLAKDYTPVPIPTAFLAREDYTLLWRLLDAGPVQAEVDVESTFTGKPVEVYNTVAEIPGKERPDEFVILGAHLDSWDLGSGATDNGTGAIAVLTAARVLQKVGVKPRRTIRFVLFTGEEQGLNGSKAYLEAHSPELSKTSAVLIHDSGTGKVLTLELSGNYGAREIMDRALYPLAQAKGIGLAELSLRTDHGSDHDSFDEAGVPAFICMQDNVDYDKTLHSQADTLDRVRWDDLVEGAQVLAVFAYNVAQLPEMLPRKPAKSRGH